MKYYEVTIYGRNKSCRKFPNYTCAWRHAQQLKEQAIQYQINVRQGKNSAI